MNSRRVIRCLSRQEIAVVVYSANEQDVLNRTIRIATFEWLYSKDSERDEREVRAQKRI